ncbi:carboxyl methyl esterase [Mucor ambiguus]|uniref:Protein phosphatase methylesterase 1 n=1 Tax=Mucor ambiguus TaxID=91626 RepID=A0A0C9MUL2_9FUNG|nr:carboxyl methyl esterase [Mucor ambiguus]
MSPSIIKSGEIPTDSDFDLQKWLKEIEGAENLMSEVEAKADTLQAKVDALLLEVGQPATFEEKQDTVMVESGNTIIAEEEDNKTPNQEPEKKQMSSLQKDMFKKSTLPPLGSLKEDENDNTEERNEPNKDNGPLFVMHHGAGSSGLTFGVTAKYIQEVSQGQCGVIAIDCRGHGASKTEVFDSDFSLEALSNDLVNIIKQTVKADQDIILVGHSMGGSVVVNVACKRVFKNIIGVSVLDVVEGSAMDALSSMTKILSSRPKKFDSEEQAIMWSIQSDTVRNVESARLSVPALIEPTKDDKYKWITDLIKTQPFWTEWFTGLSDKFLNSGTAKLLILAGTDRLDKPLIIGQMQGKFQLTIFPDAGHFLQEDTPQKTAVCLVEFWKRNQRLVLPPKVKV